jgi:protein phosphatase
VADGVGGHAAGDVASAWVVRALAERDCPPLLADRVDAMEAALTSVNSEIFNQVTRTLEGRAMGTTVATLMIEGNAGFCLWAGDSRLYRWRHGQLTQLSSDHGTASELREKGCSESAVTRQPKHIITRAVGVPPALFLDVTLFTVEPEDKFLLASDGLTNELSDDALNRLLAAQPDVNTQCSAQPRPIMVSGASLFDYETTSPVEVSHDVAQVLLQAALAGRARDNISAIVVESAGV